MELTNLYWLFLIKNPSNKGLGKNMTDKIVKKNNSLDKATITKIKQDLLARKEKILEDLKDIASKDEHDKDEHKAKFPEYGDKADENAQEIGEYTTNLATEKVLEKTLRDINNSLARIEDGSYGICKYCEQPIGEKRMLARPVASTCVACKTKLQNS